MSHEQRPALAGLGGGLKSGTRLKWRCRFVAADAASLVRARDNPCIVQACAAGLLFHLQFLTDGRTEQICPFCQFAFALQI